MATRRRSNTLRRRRDRRSQRTQQPSFPSGPVPPSTHGGAGVGQAGGGALKHAPVVMLQSEPVGLPRHSVLVWHLRQDRVGRSQMGALPVHGAGQPAPAVPHAPVVMLQSGPVELPRHSALVWHLRQARVGRSQIGAFPLQGAGQPASVRLPPSPLSDSRLPPSERLASGSDGDVFVLSSKVVVLHDITRVAAAVPASTREANIRWECAKVVMNLFHPGRSPARIVLFRSSKSLATIAGHRRSPPCSSTLCRTVRPGRATKSQSGRGICGICRSLPTPDREHQGRGPKDGPAEVPFVPPYV